MATLHDVPLDRSGVPRGKYHIIDKRGRTMRLAGINFVNGRSTLPVPAWRARGLVAAMGTYIDIECVTGGPKEPADPQPEPVAAASQEATHQSTEQAQDDKQEAKADKPKRGRRATRASKD